MKYEIRHKTQIRKKIILIIVCVMTVLAILIISQNSAAYAASNPYSGGDSNCTYTAWRLAKSETSIELPTWGNAGTWYASAQAAGYTVSKTPRAKSIVVYTGNPGHVGYVSSYNSSNGQIYVKEGGYLGGYHEGWQSASNNGIIGYIYLDGSQADTTKPIISNITISNRTSSGYTVSCKVTDNVGVTNVQFGSFETESGYKGEPWYNGSHNGDTWSFKITGLNKETHYVTHIYAYDAAGNSSSASTGKVYVDKTKPVISDVNISRKTKTGFTVSCTVNDNEKVKLVQFSAFDPDKYNGEPWFDGIRDGNTWFWTFDNLTQGKTYVCHMYAYDMCGNTDGASTIKTTIGDKNPPTISSVKVIDKTDNGFTVICDVTDNEEVTLVQFAAFNADKYNGEPWFDGIRNGNTWSWTFKSLDPTIVYVSHLYAYDADGNSSSASTERIIFGKDEEPVVSPPPSSSESTPAIAVKTNISDVTVNTKIANASTIRKAIATAGGTKDSVIKIILGKNVRKISKKAFAGFGNITTLEVKTKKLKAKSVKDALKGSNIKTVKVKVGKKKDNKEFIKKYKKIFTKKSAGRKVTVK